jgi:hypothetical protein
LQIRIDKLTGLKCEINSIGTSKKKAKTAEVPEGRNNEKNSIPCVLIQMI